MKRSVLFVLASCLALSAFTGCGDSSSPSVAETSKTETQPAAAGGETGEAVRDEIIIANREMISSCSYMNQSGGLPYCLTNDPLLYVDSEGNYQPHLCDSFEYSEDGKLMTIHLPEDLYFYDGTNVTANDWKRSFEFGLEHSSMADSWSAITSVEADGYDILIHMDNGFSSTIPFQLASVMLPVVCAEDIDNLSEDDMYWGARVYGSYYVDELVQGDHLTLKANPYYKTNNPNIRNQGKPYVDKVTVRFMTDTFAIVQGLKAGEIDIANSYLTVENLGELNAAENLTVTVAEGAGVRSIILNPEAEAFSDERVRKGMAYLIDREMLSENSDGTIYPCYSLISETAIGYSKKFEQWYKDNYTKENNIEEAQKLFAEAGWTDTDGDGYLDKDGKKFEFTLTEFSHESNLLNLLQIQFMEAGIQMNIAPVTNTGELNDVLRHKKYDAALPSNSFAEVSSILSGQIERAEIAGLFSETELAEVKDLFKKGQTCMDPDEAEDYFNQVQTRFIETTRWIPVSTNCVITVYNNEIVDGVYYRRDAEKIWLNDVK